MLGSWVRFPTSAFSPTRTQLPVGLAVALARLANPEETLTTTLLAAKFDQTAAANRAARRRWIVDLLGRQASIVSFHGIRDPMREYGWRKFP